MTKIHTIPLHIGDLLSGTIEMDAREFGAHVLLLIAHYQIGEDGLPCDEKMLARIARVTPKVWKNISGVALKGFEINIHPSGNPTLNRWVHPKCPKVIEKIQELSAQNTTKALKRWGKHNTGA